MVTARRNWVQNLIKVRRWLCVVDFLTWLFAFVDLCRKKFASSLCAVSQRILEISVLLSINSLLGPHIIIELTRLLFLI